MFDDLWAIMPVNYADIICLEEIFLFLFILGQIGFAVILLLFFYYFATILILGAQINAFFFEQYRPLGDGLGTYLNQMHKEYGVGDPRRPLCENEDDTQQQLPTTTIADLQQPRTRFLNKLRPSKITSSADEDEIGTNIV
jgi:hypothetical protein